MFDIGFPELLLASVVALLVIGPERLPETVRTIMIWLGKIKKNFANIKTEIEQEIGVDEIRQQIHNDTIMKELDEGRQHLENIFDDVQKDIQETQNEIKSTYSEPIDTKPTSKNNIAENESAEKSTVESPSDKPA
ncbi:MAG: twin-arginine translocase subunit TatB [Pseudomonadales bacterium]|nr:twin-arginine translocase subunit TatB [Pseudomonadales bacterium]